MSGSTDRLGDARPLKASPAEPEAAAARRTEMVCLSVIFGVAAAEIALLCMVFG